MQDELLDIHAADRQDHRVREPRPRRVRPARRRVVTLLPDPGRVTACSRPRWTPRCGGRTAQHGGVRRAPRTSCGSSSHGREIRQPNEEGEAGMTVATEPLVSAADETALSKRMRIRRRSGRDRLVTAGSACPAGDLGDRRPSGQPDPGRPAHRRLPGPGRHDPGRFAADGGAGERETIPDRLSARRRGGRAARPADRPVPDRRGGPRLGRHRRLRDADDRAHPRCSCSGSGWASRSRRRW